MDVFVKGSDRMSYFGLPEGASFSGLFGLSNSTSATSSMNFLNDYASIRNGSYRKLLNAYYDGNSKVDSLVSNTATSKDSAKKLTSVQEHADDLKEVADELYKQGSNSVFKKVEQEQEDGTKVKGYDTDAIYKKVSQFVESYNDLLDSTEDAEAESVGRAVKNLNSTTNANAKLLASVGIGIKGDGTLTVDEDTFKAADMNDVKSLFNGTGSYGYQVSARASMIDYAAQREASKANTYDRFGNYSNNYNFSYNSYI